MLADLRRCRELLEAIVADRALLADIPAEDRIALLIAAGRVSRPERAELDRLTMAMRKGSRRTRRELDRESKAKTGIRAARKSAVFVAPDRVLMGATIEEGAAGAPRPKLTKAKHCYVCKEDFVDLHFFYDALCPSCADVNYAKRFQTASLTGRVAVITGARVKIGFQAALMLLRAGARVIVTTRFPHDAAARYAREPDFAAWGARLSVHGLDLRHAPSVEAFCSFLDKTEERLDFLINNAAQTVRRPPAFYAHMLAAEARDGAALSTAERQLLANHHRLCTAMEEGPRPVGAALVDASSLATEPPLVSGIKDLKAGGGLGIVASAALSQIPYAIEEKTLDPALFPNGAFDADLQQIDRRRVNSWRLTLGDVPSAEMIEVQLVNSVAPFILCSKLKPLMLRRPGADRHIVNVSAMEGIFSRRTKTDKHPHTNMAKAALNMLTLTSAPDYQRDGIHMNAVDTGWVTDEDPEEISARKRHEIDFEPPLDIVDGAARILDPIFSGLTTGDHVWGKFLKAYAPAPW